MCCDHEDAFYTHGPNIYCISIQDLSATFIYERINHNRYYKYSQQVTSTRPGTLVVLLTLSDSGERRAFGAFKYSGPVTKGRKP